MLTFLIFLLFLTASQSKIPVSSWILFSFNEIEFILHLCLEEGSTFKAEAMALPPMSPILHKVRSRTYKV
jgi:hypothetical protein